MTAHPRFLRGPGGSWFLFGPRGTGKSTWLRGTHPDALWLDLLDPVLERDLSARPEQLEQDLLLAWQVPVFTRRAQRQFTAHPKLYWFDAGVFRAVRPAGPLDRSEEIEGAALEGLVAQHLRAWIDYSEADLKLHFWRTRSGNEVDFVLYGKDGFWGIEVKNRARVFPEDLRGLRAFAEDYPEARRLLIHRGSQRLRIDGVLCLPCAEFLAGLRPGKDLPG